MGPPDTELQRRTKDGPLAPSPSSVPETTPPPSGYARVLILLQVCVSHDICPEGRWLAQRLSCWALPWGPVGAVWRGADTDLVVPNAAVPFLNGEERSRVSNRNKKRFSEAFKAVVLPTLSMTSRCVWAGRQGHPLALLTCVLHQGR